MPIAPDEGQTTWPVDTDLIFAPGTSKVMLKAQCPLIWKIIQEAFENIHASLLFDNAFPDAFSIPAITSDALVAAAWSQLLKGLTIHSRLMADHEYMVKISPLVSHFIGEHDMTDDLLSHALVSPFFMGMSKSIVLLS